MSRRANLFSQQNIKFFKKNPNVFFVCLGLMCLIYGIGALFMEYTTFGIISIVFAIISFVVALIIFICREFSENSIDEKTKSNTDAQQPMTLSAPLFDFFSTTTIDYTYIKNLLYAQSMILKDITNPYEGYESHELVDVEYNLTTKNAKAIIIQTKYYKTIERYVQRNYERFPIYSDLKSKSKTYYKTFKLTRKSLDNLHESFDYFSNHVYMDIILKLNNPEFVPYHFFLKALGNQLHIAISYDEQLIQQESRKYQCLHSKKTQEISDCQAKIDLAQKDLAKHSKKLDKLCKKYKKQNDKRNLKIENVKKYIFDLESEISKLYKEISELQLEISNAKSHLETIKQQLNAHISQIQNKLTGLLKKFKPLLNDEISTDEFVLLKCLQSTEYKKIIGCYIIKNTENHKCYVGQSKDVLKRIKQHFKGTIPNNIIFAEDYYKSNLPNKEDLFEVKIIPCETKDALDSTEKELILEYDAFNSGYNGTHGNT